MNKRDYRILITGAGGSAANNFIDAIKLHFGDRIFIVGVDVSRYHLELSQVDVKLLVPPVSSPGYVDAINDIVENHKIDFIHIQPDVEVDFVARNRRAFKAPVFLPSIDEVESCQDKMVFNKIMEEHGVQVPLAFHITDPDSLKAALAELTQINSKVWLRAIRGAGSRASLPISNFYQGDAWIDYWRGFKGIDYGDFMASEFLPGHEYAWQSLWFDGELITCQARERIEYIFGNLTPSGQSSSPSVAKTVNRDDVNEIGQRAVKAINSRPHGVYCVDMKEDSTGTPRVTEINVGRFFTTSNFFAHAGLNMPAMYLEYGITGGTELTAPKFNPLADNLYWVRMIDMGYKLISEDNWTSIQKN